MKLSAFTAAFLVALASAQSRSDVPSCALPCLDDAVKSSTSCSTDDFACICDSIDAIKGYGTTCILEKCGVGTAMSKVLPATKKICEMVKRNHEEL